MTATITHTATVFVITIAAFTAFSACSSDDTASGTVADPTGTSQTTPSATVSVPMSTSVTSVVAATTTPPVAAPSKTVAPANAGTDDACSLITREEASTLVGMDLPDATRAPFSGGTSCFYQSGANSVVASRYSTPGTNALLDQYAPQFAADMVPIDGIGDAAYFSAKEGTIGVLAGDVIFTIGGLASGTPLDADVLTPVAERAISRL